MAASGHLLIVQRALLQLGFVILRTIFGIMQGVVWWINGTARALQESRRPQHYERCAQILDIRLFHKFDLLQAISVNDFICTHSRFVSPQYIFDNDYVTLMTINEHEAVFGECRQGAHLWKSEFSPFMRLSQMQHCTKLIIVPLEVFRRMSATIGDPRGRLIFLFNTARCGSTLLTQMMEATEQCVCVSEPDAPNLLAAWYRQRGDSPALRQLTSDVIRWICRPCKSLQPTAYLVKLTAPSAVALPMFHEIFPDSKNLFMYRDSVKVAKSIYRMTQELPSLKLACTLGAISAAFTERCIDSMGFAGRDFRVRLDDQLTFGLFLNILTSRSYVELRRRGLAVAAVRYEDIVADPAHACRCILLYCELPESLTTLAVRGMEYDSQRNSPLAMGILAKHAEPPLTERAKSVADRLSRQYGLPLIGDNRPLEGTITVKT